MSRQGSASFTIVIGGLTMLMVGGILLTFLHYPVTNAFMDSAFWSSQTEHGARMTTFVGGIWIFWGAIILISILSFIWIRTRQ